MTVLVPLPFGTIIRLSAWSGAAGGVPDVPLGKGASNGLPARLSGEPLVGASGFELAGPSFSRSWSVFGACRGPGQISPGSVVSGVTATPSPNTRLMLMLFVTGRLGLEP